MHQTSLETTLPLWAFVIRVKPGTADSKKYEYLYGTAS